VSVLAPVVSAAQRHAVDFLIVAACYAVSLLLATLVIRVGLRRIKPRVPPSRRPALGFWIGAFEAILVFVFVFHAAFSALAIIFAAKEYVRREKAAKDPAYYLLGTLVNVALAVLFATFAGLAIEGRDPEPRPETSLPAPIAVDPPGASHPSESDSTAGSTAQGDAGGS